MSVLAQIRQATRARHEDLEANAGVLERLACPVGRSGLMRAFLALYEPAETALCPHLAPISALDFAARRKVSALRRDLHALGETEPAVNAVRRASAPRLEGPAHALGFAYVLEGSTLGGRVIRKRLRAAGLSLEGTSFFDVYGTAAGRRWAEFCSVLERECAGRAAEAAAGALLGFDYVRRGLVDDPVVQA